MVAQSQANLIHALRLVVADQSALPELGNVQSDGRSGGGAGGGGGAISGEDFPPLHDLFIALERARREWKEAKAKADDDDSQGTRSVVDSLVDIMCELCVTAFGVQRYFGIGGGVPCKAKSTRQSRGPVHFHASIMGRAQVAQPFLFGVMSVMVVGRRVP